MKARELTPHPDPCLPCGGMDEGKMPSPLHPLLHVGCERVGPRISRVRELSLLHTSCSIQETEPYTPPGQHTRADPVFRGAGVASLKA